MTSVTASSISRNSKSLITIEEGGELYIYDSSFTNIDNTERWAVLNAGYQNSYTEVHNWTFKNNISIYGGLANIQDGGVIKFYDINIISNFSIQSGIIQVSSDGYFELYRLIVAENYAYTLSVSEIFITSKPSFFSNSSMYGNAVLTRDQIMTELDSWSMLWFISGISKQYLKENLSLLNTVLLKYSIQCISGELQIINQTFITNQPYFVISYLSTISIYNSTIYLISFLMIAYLLW